MTKNELIALLQSWPGNPEIMITWETTTHIIHEDNLYLSIDGVLMMDADSNTFKGEFMTHYKARP